MINHHTAKILILLALILAPQISTASGRYIGQAPRGGQTKQIADYTMGKEIFNGSIQLKANSSSLDYSNELQSLQEKLPDDVKARTDLKSFSHQLTADQFQSLKTFLKKRYDVSQ